MRKKVHPIQMKIQKAVLICFLSGSLGVLAQAQTPDLSLPPLPGLDVPALNAKVGESDASSTNTAPSIDQSALPPVDLPAAAPKTDSAAVTGRVPASALDALLPPVAVKAPSTPPADSPEQTPPVSDRKEESIGAAPQLAESLDVVKSSATSTPVLALPSLPSLPASQDGKSAEDVLPVPPSLAEEAAAKGVKPPKLDLPPMPEATAQALLTGQPLGKADEISPETPELKKKKPKQTMRNLPKLQPVIVPLRNAYNYQRQILPPSLYKREYSPENRHLPKATTREDYDRNLFLAVAANNVNATRAFLEMGKDVNLRNASGEPLLVVAVRYGALDTMRLLLARGADPRVSASNGVTPLQLAESSGQNVMVAVLRSRGA
jgi:Ankyrin repeats (3 copies)